MRLKRVIVATALLSAVGLAGCTSTRSALGMTKVTPDEFRVVSKAPLVVPPDYALRPPAPGEPRPQELQPESAARNALLGRRDAENRTDGEKLLAARAGADKADPLIRYVVDDETGDEKTYQIVGETEADIERGLLNIRSPLARALIGKDEGDSVDVKTPGGQRSYEVVSVRFV